jgi:hypothetical protein
MDDMPPLVPNIHHDHSFMVVTFIIVVGLSFGTFWLNGILEVFSSHFPTVGWHVWSRKLISPLYTIHWDTIGVHSLEETASEASVGGLEGALTSCSGAFRHRILVATGGSFHKNNVPTGSLQLVERHTMSKTQPNNAFLLMWGSAGATAADAVLFLARQRDLLLARIFVLAF